MVRKLWEECERAGLSTNKKREYPTVVNSDWNDLILVDAQMQRVQKDKDKETIFKKERKSKGEIQERVKRKNLIFLREEY